MTANALAIPEEVLLATLPPLPEWFERDLARIATRDGNPMFRIADGQRERKWRNGKWDVKHLLQSNGTPCYVPVFRHVFRRKNFKTGGYEYYRTHKHAKDDKNKNLVAPDHIEESKTISTRAVGRACWVVEVYEAPHEIDYDTWQQMRYQYLQVNGVSQRVDQLGEFPREGRYIACFDIVDERGNAVSPGQRHIDECKRRWLAATGDTRSTDQAIKDALGDIAEFERKQLERLNDNFYAFHGISAIRQRGGSVGKPIIQVKTA